MKTPAYINLKVIQPEVETRSAPYFPAAYTVNYGLRRHLRNDHFTLSNQWYDARHVYFYLLELLSLTPHHLPIRALHGDIHWLYQIRGSSAFPELGLHLPSQHHSTLSLREGDYELHFDKGHHILAGFVTERGWLERHVRDENDYLYKHFQYLDSQDTDISALFDIQETSFSILKKLFLLTNTELSRSISLDGILGAHAGHIVDAHLHIYNKLATDPETTLIQTIREYIKHLAVQESDMPRIEEIAQHFGITSRYLRSQFMETYSESPKNYLMRHRIAHCYELLDLYQLNPTDVAYRMGFTDAAHFNRVFKHYYGFPPSKVGKDPKA